MLQGASSSCGLCCAVTISFTASLQWFDSVCTLQETVDGDGLCCDGEVDKCGVCGGSNTSCGTVVEIFAIVNTTGNSDENNVIDNAVSTVELMIAEALKFPNALVSVRDVNEIVVQYEAGEVGGYGAAGLAAAGGYGSQKLQQAAYGDMQGQELSALVDKSMIGGPDSTAPMAAMTVCSANGLWQVFSARLPGIQTFHLVQAQGSW